MNFGKEHLFVRLSEGAEESFGLICAAPCIVPTAHVLSAKLNFGRN